jgi:hypothetical protein
MSGQQRLSPSGQWADERLSDAYSLIDAVLAETHPESDARAFLLKAAEAVEDADMALERGQ